MSTKRPFSMSEYGNTGTSKSSEESSQSMPKNFSMSEYGKTAPVESIEQKSTEEEKKPNTYEEVGRHVNRTGARVAEQALGFAGNTQNFIKSLITGGYEGVTGEEAPEGVKEFSENLTNPMSLMLGENNLKKVRDLAPDSKLMKMATGQMPTSSDIKEHVTEPIAEMTTGSKEYIRPQSKGEDFSDELTEDISNMLMPGGGKAKPFVKLARAVGIPLGGMLAKEGVKLGGGSEEAQNYTKMGANFMLSLMSKGKGAKAHANSLLSEAEKNIPHGASIAIPTHGPIINNLKNLIDKLESGSRSAPGKQEAMSELKEWIRNFEKTAQKGTISVKDAVEFNRNINSRIKAMKGFAIDLETRKQGVGYMENLKSANRSLLEEYGSKNPKFGVPYEAGNRAYGTFEQSQKVSDWIDKNYSKPIASMGFKHLFGLGAATIAKGLYPVHKGLQYAYQIAKSPELAKYYANGIKAAAEENRNAMISNFSKLDEGIKDLEDEDPFIKR